MVMMLFLSPDLEQFEDVLLPIPAVPLHADTDCDQCALGIPLAERVGMNLEHLARLIEREQLRYLPSVLCGFRH
jgi:hypothetical protein